nr:tyrosine recombinase XerC [Bdellovibrio sp. HM001]
MSSDANKAISNKARYGDFAHETISAKQRPYVSNATDQLVKVIAKEVNRHKLSYEQLKRVFREVRTRCHLETPKQGTKLIELPSDADLEKFFSVINDPVHKLIFKFLLGTGLRIAELCALEVRRIDFTQNTAFIKEGKGRKDRVIVFGNNLKSKLELYLAGRNNRYLFESTLQSKYTPRRIQQLAVQYSKASEVRIHPHLLRHIFATKLAEAGLSEDQRAVLCGHSKSSNAQQIYTHLSLAGVKNQAIDALDKI